MAPTAALTDAPTLIQVPIEELFPSPLNPRKKFTPASLMDLADNIQKRGEVVQPLLLRSRGKKFEIIDGERRYRASQSAGNIVALPGLVRDDLSDADAIEFMLLTSIQKQELTPLEEAGGFKALIDSNKSKYSVAYIADRIGRSEKYVWDRMKLLDLIPVIKKLLEADRILVGHAELLAKLKPEDQDRAVAWDSNWSLGSRSGKGLWESEDARLDLDEDQDREPSAKNLYRGLKPVTVKELESWIAHHVRFDVEHMAKAAPLEFGQVAKDVEHAEALPGRGKKVVAITHEYRVADDARDATERTYGSNSWERADGKEKSKTCDFSVLGTVVAGRGYGSTLQVCINRDKCTVHFGKVIKEREKNQKLRQQGKGGQAAQREKKAAETSDQKWKREQAERVAREKAWKELSGHLWAAAWDQVKGVKALTAKQVKFFEDQYEININPEACKERGIKWTDNLALSLLVSEIDHQIENADDFEDFVARFAKPVGLDIKQLEVARDKHAPKAEPTAAPAKAAKKAKKR